MKRRSKSQRVLQLAMGGVLICLIFLFERLAVPPDGIYSYSGSGYKEFKVGMKKEEILSRINDRKSIRSVTLCHPESEFERRARAIEIPREDMERSDIWTCHDRDGKKYLFLFQENRLKRILLIRASDAVADEISFFDRCRENLSIQTLDQILNGLKETKVFYEPSK